MLESMAVLCNVLGNVISPSAILIANGFIICCTYDELFLINLLYIIFQMFFVGTNETMMLFPIFNVFHFGYFISSMFNFSLLNCQVYIYMDFVISGMSG